MTSDSEAHSAFSLVLPLTTLLLLFYNTKYRCSGCTIRNSCFKCSYKSGYSV